MSAEPVRRYGRRKFTKMYALISDLRKAIREHDAEKTEAIWDQCEPFIDVVFERETGGEIYEERSPIEDWQGIPITPGLLRLMGAISAHENRATGEMILKLKRGAE